jgi:SAM-dependent methyltransferase
MIAIDPERTETRIIHQLIDFNDAKVLEVGCGDGRLTGQYAQYADSIMALDPNQEAVEQARKSAPKELQSRIDFHEADITTFNLPQAAFDVAILSRSFAKVKCDSTSSAILIVWIPVCPIYPNVGLMRSWTKRLPNVPAPCFPVRARFEFVRLYKPCV